MYKSVKNVDPALLIEEVKKRPLLYDSRIGIVSTESRRSTWFEISQIFIQSFELMTSVERENICREMQAKWKALRDSYRRTIRIEERDRRLGINPGRRSKYYYFDQLNFLAEHCGPKGTKCKSEKAQQDTSTSDHQDSNCSLMLDQDDTLNNGFANNYSFISFKKEQESSVSTPSADHDRSAVYSDSKKVKVDEIKTDINERIVKILEEMNEFQRNEKADNPMGNKNFLLSLLPFMDKLTNEQNLQVRVHFMNILQSYNNNNKIISKRDQE